MEEGLLPQTPTSVSPSVSCPALDNLPPSFIQARIITEYIKRKLGIPCTWFKNECIVETDNRKFKKILEHLGYYGYYSEDINKLFRKGKYLHITCLTGNDWIGEESKILKWVIENKLFNKKSLEFNRKAVKLAFLEK